MEMINTVRGRGQRIVLNRQLCLSDVKFHNNVGLSASFFLKKKLFPIKIKYPNAPKQGHTRPYEKINT